MLNKIKKIKFNITNLAISKNVEEKWQTFVHKLCGTIIRPDMQEILQQLIYHTVQMAVGCRERGHPTVQAPRHSKIAKVKSDLFKDQLTNSISCFKKLTSKPEIQIIIKVKQLTQMIVFSTVIHGLLQAFNLGLAKF